MKKKLNMTNCSLSSKGWKKQNKALFFPVRVIRLASWKVLKVYARSHTHIHASLLYKMLT